MAGSLDPIANMKLQHSEPLEGAAASGPQPLHVFVLIDALGWQIIKDRPFLNKELKYRKPLKTILGFSSGAIPTILTGQQPSESGRWNLLYLDPPNSPFKWLRWFSFLPEGVLDSRYTRKLIKEAGRRLLGMGPLFECAVSPRLLPWFDWVEKENIYAPGGIRGCVSIFDLLQSRGISHRIYSYHKWSDAEILQQAKQQVRSGTVRFLFLYLSQVDHFLHGNCGGSAVDNHLAWYESELRALFHLATTHNSMTTFTVVSDHGMTPVTSRFDLVGQIEALGLKMPEQYLAVYDSTMARYWFFDREAREKVTNELEKLSCGRILDDAELERLGVLFADRRYGELIFLLNPGWMIAHSDFNGPAWNPSGMHGYHPSDPHSDAIYLSNETPKTQPSVISDVFTIMADAASVK